MEQRKFFLSEKALCKACYVKNQLSKKCTRKRTCKKCKRLHSALLHMEGFSLDKESGAVNRETTGNDKPLKVNNACVDIPQESNLENDILLQTILPVVVTQKGANKAMKTWKRRMLYHRTSQDAPCGNKYRYGNSIRNYARLEPCR